MVNKKSLEIKELFLRRIRLRNIRPVSFIYAVLCTIPITILSISIVELVSAKVGFLVIVLALGFVHFYLAHRWKEALFDALNVYQTQTSALIQIASLNLRYRLPFTPMSMPPEDLLELWGRIIHKAPQLVVECGTGVSTLVIAHLLRTLGNGKLIGIEHDKNWALLLQRLIKQNDLTEYCQIVLAPLSVAEQQADAQRWYDFRVLDPLLKNAIADILLVDGPPRISGPLARYPALPYFIDKLAIDGEIILDDINRPDEQEIATRWQQEFPLKLVGYTSSGRVGVFKRYGKAESWN